MHGRLSVLEKQEVMDAFKQGKIDILVATTETEKDLEMRGCGELLKDKLQT